MGTTVPTKQHIRNMPSLDNIHLEVAYSGYNDDNLTNQGKSQIVDSRYLASELVPSGTCGRRETLQGNSLQIQV